MGQHCQAETFHGFIPYSLQGKTLLLPELLLVLHFVPLLVFAFVPKEGPASNSSWNLHGG